MMMKKVRSVLVVLTLLSIPALLVGAVTLVDSADAEPVTPTPAEMFDYSIENNEVTITKYTGSEIGRAHV